MVRFTLSLVSLISLAAVSSAHPSFARRANVLKRAADAIATYDYVIVGGGTAGLTLADRLTEDSSINVLVIDPSILDTGIGEEQILLPSTTWGVNLWHNWNYTYIPQPGLDNRTGILLSGHAIGGGSAINGMFFDRPAAADLDVWAELGNDGWDWNNMLPYYKRSVGFTPPSQELVDEYGYTFDANYYGNGPVQSSFPPFQWPGQLIFRKGWVELGTPEIQEAVSGNKSGLVWVSNALDPVTRTRSFSRTAHYDPYATRPNYHLLTEHTVTEIAWKSGKKLVARGVIAKANDGTVTTFYAKNEVILSAGTVKDPWILQRSGVGPNKILREAGIKVRLDLPGVGANFQDQPYMLLNYTLNNDVHPNPDDLTNNLTYAAEQQTLYDTKREGPYTLSRGNAAAFLPAKWVVGSSLLSSLLRKLKTQNLADYAPSTDKTVLAGYKKQVEITAKQWQGDLPSFETPLTDTGIAPISLQKPLSRGTININPSNLDAMPLIDFKVMNNPIDVSLMTAFVRYTRKVFQTPSISALKPVENSPGAEATTDAEIEAWIRSSAVEPSFAHPVGTSSMLPRELGGVVDTELKVYGVENLRIVDASIIPWLPSCHTSSTTYAIAERAVDIILRRT